MNRDDSRTFCTYIMPNSKCVKSYNTKEHNTWTLTGLPAASQFLQHLASSWNLPQCMNWRALWLVGILHPVDYLVMVVWCLETILVTGNKPHIHITVFWVRQDTSTQCCAGTTLVHGNYCNWTEAVRSTQDVIITSKCVLFPVRTDWGSHSKDNWRSKFC